MKYIIQIISILLISIFSANTTLAEDMIDTSFGNAGKVMEVYNAEKGGAEFNALLIQNDNKIIATGTAKNADGNSIITLYRYLPDGTKDLSFGNEGITTADHVCTDYELCGTTYPAGSENVVDALFQSDGKIILAQTAWAGGSYTRYSGFGLARFNPDGTLDTSFGAHSGFGFGGNGNQAKNATVQADDKVLIVGQAHSSGPQNLALTRYTADGFVDTSFGEQNGTVLLNTHPGSGSYSGDVGYDVAVQSGGKIIVVGSSAVQGCGNDTESLFTRGLLLRYNEDGSLDTQFGNAGIIKFNIADIFDAKPWDLSTPFPCSESIFSAVKIQPDDKIIVMGQGFNAPFSVFLVRFNRDGSLDTSFGYEGAIAIYDDYTYTHYDHLNTVFTSNGQTISVKNMRLLKNGQIILSGHYYKGSDYYNVQFMALRFTQAGQLDRRFASDGMATVNVNFADPEDEFLYGGASAIDVAEQADGKILLAGFAGGYYNVQHAVLVRLPLTKQSCTEATLNSDLILNIPYIEYKPLFQPAIYLSLTANYMPERDSAIYFAIADYSLLADTDIPDNCAVASLSPSLQLQLPLLKFNASDEALNLQVDFQIEADNNNQFYLKVEQVAAPE